MLQDRVSQLEREMESLRKGPYMTTGDSHERDLTLLLIDFSQKTAGYVPLSSTAHHNPYLHRSCSVHHSQQKLLQEIEERNPLTASSPFR